MIDGRIHMQSVTFLIKPASSLCNMRCRYCFYHDISDIREVKSMGMMSEDTAEALIRAAFSAVAPGGFVQFTFQGGEPTLAGLEFYRRFMALEAQYRPKNVTVGHAIQTNGLALDGQWAAFLKEHGYLVGISLDGNQAIHDAYRRDAAGDGTWERVTQKIALLDHYQVESNLLCVVSSTVAKNPQKVYAAMKKLGNHPLQFIPCLDPMEAQRGKESYSLKPEGYGRFLCGLFDCWHRDWKTGTYVSIRNFDDYLRILLGMPPSTCAASGACGSYLVVEGDGSLYPCDFYVLDQWYLGNIRTCTVAEALSGEKSKQFLADGQKRPEDCRACPYAPLCRGGCKRDWMENGGNYYCSSFRTFFAYALPRLQEMAAAFRRNP